MSAFDRLSELTSVHLGNGPYRYENGFVYGPAGRLSLTLYPELIELLPALLKEVSEAWEEVSSLEMLCEELRDSID